MRSWAWIQRFGRGRGTKHGVWAWGQWVVRWTNGFSSRWLSFGLDWNAQQRIEKILDPICSTSSFHETIGETQGSSATWTTVSGWETRSEHDCSRRSFCIPSSRSSTAMRTPLSKARASAAVWNVRPNFWSPVRQWWNVGITLLYWKSLPMVQLSTTCKGNNARP